MTKKNKPPKKPEEIAQLLGEALQRDVATFTSALMEIIRERGITSAARETGISRHTLYRYEWGTDRPLFETVVKMTAACGMKLTVVPDD